MTRRAGSINKDHAERRDALVSRLRRAFLAEGGHQASLRELAVQSDVSVPTLRHYFGTRTGVVRAVFQHARAEGEPFMRMNVEADGPLEESLRAFLQGLIIAWRSSEVGGLHGLGLALGLGDQELGPDYVRELLEPTLATAEAKLARHQARRELVAPDLRVAALALVSPVLLALLHQEGLFGARCRPLDIEAMVEQHLAGFLTGYKLKARRRGPQ